MSITPTAGSAHAEEVGPLVHAPRRPAARRWSRPRSPACAGDVYRSCDQPLGRGDEVVEDVLLLQLRARLVPRLAVLAAAAEVGHRVDAAQLHPGEPVRRERRRQRRC